MTSTFEAGEVLPDIDFSQLLNVDSESIWTDQDLAFALSNDNSPQCHCEARSGDDCLCHGFYTDLNLPTANNAEPLLGHQEPEYFDLEETASRFVRPQTPCQYCKAKGLICYIALGEAQCVSCLTLPRECSLANVRALEPIAHNYSSHVPLDALHVVDENICNALQRVDGDICKVQKVVAEKRVLASKDGSSGVGANVHLDDAPGSTKRNGIRFPRDAVMVLRHWFDAHTDHPYPTPEQKADLEMRTQLKPSQIADWLANARRRQKVAGQTRVRPAMSPSLRPTTPAIAIPLSEKPWDELNPLERWKHSPPENDPASMTDIANAVANTEIVPRPASRARLNGRRNISSDGSGQSRSLAPSTTSLETYGQHSFSSSTATSHASSISRASFGSFSSGLAGKRSKRRARRPIAPLHQSSDDRKRPFQCTFCTDTFKAKYDWTRHEKSLHLSLEKWICAPLGPVTMQSVGNVSLKKCVFCDTLDPDDDHRRSHNHRPCEEKGLEARTFYRKDHLRQHLRLMHNVEMSPLMDSWSSTAVNINSRCGFCAQRFSVWQERVDHLAKHFKDGIRMSEWKGCRGLDPAVAAQVTNAMPPYLIGIEAVSPNPFRASHGARFERQSTENVTNTEQLTSGDLGGRPSADVNNGNSAQLATCWEILTVRLGKYANDMVKQGTVLSDEMLQLQARRILYDSDDSWNQTAADQPEWLDLFKKAHGLDYIPTTVGGQGTQVPEDLETYGDLGLRIPFNVQLENYARFAQAQTTAFQQRSDTMQVAATESMQNGHAALASDPLDEGGRCRIMEHGDRLNAAIKATAEGPAALAALNNRMYNSCDCDEARCASKMSYLGRHKLQLPVDRARRFQTVTGAWEDSGTMPEILQTATLCTGDLDTNHELMMTDVCSSNLGEQLTLSNDQSTAHTSLPTVPLADFGVVASDAEILQQLDDLLAAPAAPQDSVMADQSRMLMDTSWMTMDESLPPLSAPAGKETNLGLGDFSFDDIVFDMFDMPADEDFGAGDSR